MKRLGIDVGSTTLKCVVMDEENNLLFSDYMRHFSRIAEKLGGLLSLIGERFPGEDMELALSGSAGIHKHEPRRTEGIADREPRRHRRNADGKPGSEQLFCAPINQSDKNEAHDVSACCSEQNSYAPAESGEHRKADRSKQDIDQDRYCPPFSAQKAQNAEHAEGLHRKGHRRRNRNPCADGNQRRPDRHICQIRNTKLFRRFLHKNAPPIRSVPGARREYSILPADCQPD